MPKRGSERAPPGGSTPREEAIEEPAGGGTRVDERVNVVRMRSDRVPTAMPEQGHNAPVRHPRRVRGRGRPATGRVGREKRPDRGRNSRRGARIREPARHLVARRRPAGAELTEQRLVGASARGRKPGKAVAEEGKRKVRFDGRWGDGVREPVGPPAPLRILVPDDLKLDGAIGAHVDVGDGQSQQLRRAAEEQERRGDGRQPGARGRAGGFGRRGGDEPGGGGRELGALGGQGAHPVQPAAGVARPHRREEGASARAGVAGGRVPRVNGAEVGLEARRSHRAAGVEGSEVGRDRFGRRCERRPPGRRAERGKLAPVLVVLGRRVGGQRRHMQVGCDSGGRIATKAAHDVGAHKVAPAGGGHALPPFVKRKAAVRHARLGVGARPRPCV